jgi:hypothetical protein
MRFVHCDRKQAHFWPVSLNCLFFFRFLASEPGTTVLPNEQTAYETFSARFAAMSELRRRAATASP